MDGPRETPPDEPRVGVDEWVATYEGRRERGEGVLGRLRYELGRAPRPAFYLGFGVVAALLPSLTTSCVSASTRSSTCCLRSG
jgi:hypothetical protein